MLKTHTESVKKREGVRFFEAPLCPLKPTPSTSFIHEKKHSAWGWMFFATKLHNKSIIKIKKNNNSEYQTRGKYMDRPLNYK